MFSFVGCLNDFAPDTVNCRNLQDSWYCCIFRLHLFVTSYSLSAFSQHFDSALCENNNKNQMKVGFLCQEIICTTFSSHLNVTSIPFLHVLIDKKRKEEEEEEEKKKKKRVYPAKIPVLCTSLPSELSVRVCVCISNIQNVALHRSALKNGRCALMKKSQGKASLNFWFVQGWWWWSRTSCPRMSVDIIIRDKPRPMREHGSV